LLDVSLLYLLYLGLLHFSHFFQVLGLLLLYRFIISLFTTTCAGKSDFILILAWHALLGLRHLAWHALLGLRHLAWHALLGLRHLAWHALLGLRHLAWHALLGLRHLAWHALLGLRHLAWHLAWHPLLGLRQLGNTDIPIRLPSSWNHIISLRCTSFPQTINKVLNLMVRCILNQTFISLDIIIRLIFLFDHLILLIAAGLSPNLNVGLSKHQWP
jgi:hypothetical protein